MSFLDKARRRLSETGRRGSLPGTQFLGSAGNTPPPAEHMHMVKSEITNSNDSTLSWSNGKWDSEPIVEHEKTDPSSYLFLIRTDPMLDWQEARNLELNQLNPHDGMSIDLKVYQNRTRDSASICQVLSKFADESVDDYLFEIGILTESLPKFGDYMNEIEALRECRNHRNVLDFYDAYYFDSKLWIFTEYCSHGTVEKLLNDMNKPLTMMQIHYIVKEALTALEYLHDRIKICHRDLKGANLFIADDLSVKIANFTLSAKCDSSSKKHIIAPKAPHFIALEVLKTGYYFVRSPHFMAPEVVRPYLNQYDNPKSDVWSLGITCIEMAEVFPPLKLLSPEVVIQEINNDKFRPSLKEPSKWDASFVKFLERCLNRNPELRASSKDLLNHEFIVKFKTLSSKHDIQEALNDRKVALLEDTKQKIQRLEQTVESLSLIKFKPDAFVKSYFDELKRSIDAKAEEARRKIDDDQREMTDLLQKYHDACLSHLKKSGVRFESDTIDSIVARFQSSAGAWHQSVSEPSASENDLVHTNAETESFGKFANNELSKIKLTMFGDKVYELKALSREAVRFGKLVALDGKNLVEVSETHNHLQEGTGSRPINKLIRFDIKGTKRK